MQVRILLPNITWNSKRVMQYSLKHYYKKKGNFSKHSPELAVQNRIWLMDYNNSKANRHSAQQVLAKREDIQKEKSFKTEGRKRPKQF